MWGNVLCLVESLIEFTCVVRVGHVGSWSVVNHMASLSLVCFFGFYFFIISCFTGFCFLGVCDGCFCGVWVVWRGWVGVVWGLVLFVFVFVVWLGCFDLFLWVFPHFYFLRGFVMSGVSGQVCGSQRVVGGGVSAASGVSGGVRVGARGRGVNKSDFFFPRHSKPSVADLGRFYGLFAGGLVGEVGGCVNVGDCVVGVVRRVLELEDGFVGLPVCARRGFVDWCFVAGGGGDCGGVGVGCGGGVKKNVNVGSRTVVRFGGCVLTHVFDGGGVHIRLVFSLGGGRDHVVCFDSKSPDGAMESLFFCLRDNRKLIKFA